MNHLGLVALCLLGWIPWPASAHAAIFIETQVDPVSPYVQAQVRYRVRLFRRSVFDTGDFLAPYTPDLLRFAVAEDDPVEIRRDGVTYQMIERRYLLFPLRSGTMEIPGEIFSGRDIYVRGPPMALKVRPAAVSGTPWIPASHLRLTQRMEGDVHSLRVGDFLYRTLIIEATGLTGAQLPALDFPTPPGLERQRIHVEVKEHIEGFDVVGRRLERYRIVPLRAGTFTLPAQEVTWWDTSTDLPRTAMLPAVMLKVAPGGPGTSVAGPKPTRATPAGGFLAPSGGHWWSWLVGVTFSLLLVLSGWFLRTVMKGAFARYASLRRLRRACLRDDPEGAAAALAEWARLVWGAPLSPLEVAGQLADAEARSTLQVLDGAIYGDGPRWQGRDLLVHGLPALHRLSRRNPPRPPPLPPLNP